MAKCGSRGVLAWWLFTTVLVTLTAAKTSFSEVPSFINSVQISIVTYKLELVVCSVSTLMASELA